MYRLHDLRQRLRASLSPLTEQSESEIRTILKVVLDIDAAQCVLEPEREITAEEWARVDAVIRRREEREPLQYILGNVGFRSIDLKMAPGVLIPRPETECMVDWLLERSRRMGRLRSQTREGTVYAAEIGIGSGAISIAFAQEWKPVSDEDLQIDAVDCSPEALEIARENIANHSLAAKRIALFRGDLFDAFPDGKRYDLIYSNPPYVPESDRAFLAPEVAQYEPSVALFAGDGLDCYRRIFEQLGERLAPGGAAIFEIGKGQDEAVMAIARHHGYRNLEALKDYAGIRRFVVCSID
ncbi:MAG: peptide chain release factor N(5)-glutamine methyltransferase [Bacillota bacterium]|nr:peptide chain release factor N(5)-glutamine methyltransferase [Bacillota bacterium]